MEALSKEEILALLGAARAGKERDWLMILVTYRHGLRASEVIQITPDNIRDGYLYVDRLKGSEATKQQLKTHANPLLSERAALLALARKSNRKQRLFPITRQHFWRLMKKYGAQAGIPWHKLMPHSLKASIITQIVEKYGVPKGQAWAGHKAGSSTLRYTKPKAAAIEQAASDAVDV